MGGRDRWKWERRLVKRRTAARGNGKQGQMERTRGLRARTQGNFLLMIRERERGPRRWMFVTHRENSLWRQKEVEKRKEERKARE